MSSSSLLARLCLAMLICLSFSLSVPNISVAQEVKVTDSIFDGGTGKWLKESLQKQKKDIEENKLDANGKRPKRRLVDELCTKLPDDLDERLKKDLLMGDADRDKLHAYYLSDASGLLDEKCWCKLFKKWNLKGKFYSLDVTAAEYCPDVTPKKPDGGAKDGPTPTPTPAPTPTDGKSGGIKDGPRICPEGLELIDDCVQKHGLKLTLTGDGTATSHSKLTVIDPKTGKSSSVALETVCMSLKTKLPPPTDEVAAKQKIYYRVGSAAPSFVAQILNAVDSLDAQNKYGKVPVPASRLKATITQLAIWQHLGGKDQGKDAINRNNVKDDMLKKAGLKASELTENEDSRLNDRVDLICEAVDLTCKESTTTTTERRKIKKEKPGVPVPRIPTGGRTEDGEKPENPEHPENPKGGGGDDGGGGEIPRQPGCPGEEIVCIPELTTFECENTEYQTMCTVTDNTIKCPLDGAIPVNVPDKNDCKWRPCDVITVPHVLPRIVKKAGMEDPEQGLKDESRHTKEVEAHNAALEIAKDKAKAANNPRATSLVGAIGPFNITGLDVYIVYLCVKADGSVHDVHTQLVSGDEAKLWDPANFNKKGNQEKREDVIQKYRGTGQTKM